jgi:hypothetical protein
MSSIDISNRRRFLNHIGQAYFRLLFTGKPTFAALYVPVLYPIRASWILTFDVLKTQEGLAHSARICHIGWAMTLNDLSVPTQSQPTPS